MTSSDFVIRPKNCIQHIKQTYEKEKDEEETNLKGLFHAILQQKIVGDTQEVRFGGRGFADQDFEERVVLFLESNVCKKKK